MSIDFRKHCPTCSWCCHGESVFVSAAEADTLGQDTLKHSADGSCEKLDPKTRLCTAHERRPIECRLFPLDILELEVDEGVTRPTWVIWTGPCSATTEMSKSFIEAALTQWEGRLTLGWMREYLKHHEKNQPSKYAASRAIRLRTVRLSG